jgi:hypothetical protein
MKGKRISDRKDRDRYMKESYPQAQKIAKKMGAVYKAVSGPFHSTEIRTCRRGHLRTGSTTIPVPSDIFIKQ